MLSVAAAPGYILAISALLWSAGPYLQQPQTKVAPKANIQHTASATGSGQALNCICQCNCEESLRCEVIQSASWEILVSLLVTSAISVCVIVRELCCLTRGIPLRSHTEQSRQKGTGKGVRGVLGQISDQ